MKQILQKIPAFFSSLLFLLFCSLSSHAQYNSTPSINTATCTTIYDYSVPKIASDGSVGAIITWEDNRNGNNDIYAQRINASGAVQYTTDGVAINLIYAF